MKSDAELVLHDPNVRETEMNHVELISNGAFALYRSEMSYRINEFEKSANPDALIAADFAKFRNRYTRKFEDMVEHFAAQGLQIVRTAS
jgi:hypothetical protein